MRLGPTFERLDEELGTDIDFYRLEVRSDDPEHWAQVREHFRVGPRLPLISLFAFGRWQRSLQGPAPREVAHPFIVGGLGLNASGEVIS